MKIKSTLLLLPHLFLFTSCDDDSSAPPTPVSFEPVSIIGKTVTFTGVLEVTVVRPEFGGVFETNRFQSQEISAFSSDGPVERNFTTTFVSRETDAPLVGIAPPVGDVQNDVSNFLYGYSFDPVSRTGTLTILNALSLGGDRDDITRVIRYETPNSGTWSETGTVNNAGITLSSTGSGTFLISE